MKHVLYITIILLIPLITKAESQNQYIYNTICLQIETSYFDPTINTGNIPMCPIKNPILKQHDHTLILSPECGNSILEIISCDNNENIVYSEYIAPGVSVIVLPKNLSGEYHIKLIKNNICFIGNIIL